MVGKNEDVQVWEKNLFNAIKDVSDIDFQQKAWMGKDPQYLSSYSEVISILYDDFDFERYIQYYESIKEDDTLYKLFLELNQMINEYEAPETDELILADPEWIEITNKAKETWLLLSKEHN